MGGGRGGRCLGARLIICSMPDFQYVSLHFFSLDAFPFWNSFRAWKLKGNPMTHAAHTCISTAVDRGVSEMDWFECQVVHSCHS